MMPHEGMSAPEFTLLDQDGRTCTLAEYRGQWVLVYFYPKDDTPGCTKEACLLRDGFPLFESLHAVVLGISTDSVASHRAFAQKHGLPFRLLADEEKVVVNAYGVWGPKTMMGIKYEGTTRASFLIGPDGVIAKVYPNVDPATHAQEVLADLTAFRGA